MDKINIRYYILTRFKLGCTAKQIHVELCDAWGEDDPRVGRPVTGVTDENIETVRMLIEENPHISIRYLAFETGVPYGTINSITHDELKLKTLCA
ncbi:unnamed protein product [Rotaria magnacalcarata]|uniref:Mos1 transposase HTH domain-containing protein n=2 Tax=Rotaria TaxID=231623 RepID=A0A816C740_9BILA|nr:unnamed protein product [Rotaria magnacalcarata]CAF3397028.1 unnamed protein product [Rotaria socialis]CAF1617880.1 unnamed protein product [Rotaria magnacalcarata]CAF3465967.1 unnamed protein product [Rotaria socialis]CAF3518640.1 unnamed protein product [Rotaria socialis]